MSSLPVTTPSSPSTQSPPSTQSLPSPNTKVHPIFQYLGNGNDDNIKANSTPTALRQIRDKVDTFITHSLWFSPLIETSKSLLAFLPGRFSTSNLSGEAIYTILTLVGQYNDQVLGKATYNPYSVRHMADLNNNIQHQQSDTVRYLNTGLHFFSIFEALLEQTSSHLFTHINRQEYQSIQNGITERGSYLTAILQQEAQIDPVTNQIRFDFSSFNFEGGSSGGGDTTAPAATTTTPSSPTPAILQFQTQFKRFPHEYDAAPVTSAQYDSSPGDLLETTSAINSNQEFQLKQQLLYQPAFNFILNAVLGGDKLYRYLSSLDTNWMTRLFQFKMYACALIEFIKFALRMTMLIINKGHMNLPNTAKDSNIQQLQYKNLAEQKRYKRDQLDLIGYTQTIANWSTANGNNSNPTTTKTTNTKNAGSSSSSLSSVSKPPSAPALASSFSSTLTTTPFTSLKNVGNTSPTSPTTASSSSSSSSSLTAAITSAQQARIAAQPLEKTTDLGIVKNLKALYLQRHRGVITHGQFAFNLIQTYFHHYHLFPTHGTNTGTEQSDHDLNTTTTTVQSSTNNPNSVIVPHHTFIDYVLALYNINPISPNSTTLHPTPQDQSHEDTNTASLPGQAIENEEELEPEPEQDHHQFTVGDLDKPSLDQTPLHSALSTALPPNPPLKHVISEVLYWLRPVVYTLSSALCNQPALSQFVTSTLLKTSSAGMGTGPIHQTQQTTTPAPIRTDKWWSNLLISTNLSSPSVLPTILSLVIDFIALYLSPAWDSKQTLHKLLLAQQQERQSLHKLSSAAQQSSPTSSTPTTTPTSSSSLSSSTPTKSQLAKNANVVHPITNVILHHQHQQQLELTQSQLATWQQRKSNYWLYIFRPPFLTVCLLKPLTWLAHKLANIPLIGGFLQFAIALLKIFQHHYFYASGS